MTTDIEIPEGPESVTAAWLTGALRTTIPDAEVTAVHVLDQHSGTTGRLRLALEHAPGAHGPETVFVKLAPDTESQRKLVAAMDMTGLRQQLHQLKDGAAVCAVTAFIEVLDELHDAARNKDQQLIPEYFLDLRRCADSLLG